MTFVSRSTFSLEGFDKTFNLLEMRVFFSLFISMVGFLTGAEVSTIPPNWYQEVIAPQLSSMDDLDLEPGKELIEDEPGVILLTESVSRIRPNGAKDVVYHFIYRPLTEKGVEQVQEERFSFSAERQKMHLIKARTISPEGKVTEAAQDGIFLQRPEGDGDSSIYDDREDLVVIYSDVKVGCLVEIIVLREELEPRVKGEASGWMNWASGGWPAMKRRSVVGVGEKMNERFQFKTIGKGVPNAEISQVKKVIWYDWSARELSSRPYEVNRPPTSQTGPSVRYTTFQSWEQVGKWYGKLVEPQSLMESPLRTEMEKAVGDLTKPREVLAALYPLAAKEVRYTGLEFGHSGILPYSCNQVWDRKYGDCKDKSTLLVSMLRSQGIEAWVGLVSTNSEGLIPREVPGTRVFNHAIAIVDVDPSEKEELVFCDPTISYGAPGIIAPSTADRDVLLTSSEGGRLVRSPKVTAGSYDYDFEIEMDEAGRMSGWLNWKSTGYYAVSTASTYDGMDRESARSRMARMVRNFFPDAEVVDFEIPDDLKPGMSECVLKVFFTTELGEQAAGANIPVNFPSSSSIFMNYGDQKKRESDYFQWQDAISVTMSLKIAKGLVPVVLHPPLRALSPGYHIDAKWEFEPTKLKASLKVKCMKSSLNPEEVLAGQQASRAWARWSGQPLLLKAGEDWKAPAANPEVKLPLMPSGQGQLNLVRRWYPLGQESKRRELALKKVLQLFPDDPETLYDTRLALAYIDYYADRMEEAIAAYEKLASKRPSGVSGENYSLAHYMVGLCAYEMRSFKKAESFYEKSVGLEGVSDYRRGWGLTGQAQSLLKLGQLDQALTIFQKAEKVESTHRFEMLQSFIHCYLKKDQVDEAVAAWTRLKTVLGEESMTVVEGLAKGPADPDLASNVQLKKFFDALKPKLNQEEAISLNAFVSDFTYQREKLKAAAELRTRLLAILDERSPEYLSKDLHLAIADQETYQDKLDGFRDDNAPQWLNHCYGYLARFEVDDVFTTYFWNFVLHVDWKESTLPKSQQLLMESLIPLCELIPHQDDNYWELQFVVADYFQDKGDWKKAEEIYRAMPEDPLFNEDFNATAWQRRGLALERLGQWEEAVKVHLHLKEERMELVQVCDQLMRAGWILARLGKADEALNTWSLLKEVPASLYESCADVDRIEEAALLAGMPEKTKAYWKHTAKWWDETLEDYLEANGLKISADPLLSDSAQLFTTQDDLTGKIEDLDLEELSHIVTVFFSGARWFPSFTTSVQDLFENYIRPVTRPQNEDFRRVALALLDSVNAGAELSQISAMEQAHFYKVVLKEEGALNHGYEILKRLDDEKYDGARQLALRRLALVASRDQKDLEKVEKLLRKDWGLRARTQGRINIGVAIAQMLEEQGKIQQAIDFTKEVLNVPVINEDPEKVKAVDRYLETLEGESRDKQAFIGQIESLRRVDPTPWLAHVGPDNLDEEGYEDPADFLAGTGDSRHVTEDYKWGFLLLKSDLVTREQRAQVFRRLLDFHYGRILKNSQARKVIDEILENDRLPEVMRRQLLWLFAVDASFVQVDEKLTTKLSKHPLAEGLAEPLRLRGFQDLLSVVRAKNGNGKELLAQLKLIVERGEMNMVSSGSIENILSAVPRYLDRELNAEIETFLKSIKLEGRTARQMRQEVIRFRKKAAEVYDEFQFVRILKPAFQKRLEKLAEQAPTDWDDFSNYSGL